MLTELGGIDVGIIFGYLMMLLVIGILTSRKQGSVEDYFLASGRVGTISVACLWLASWVGGAAIVGGAANAYDVGISSAWYMGAMAIGCLLFGLFFSVRIKRIGARERLLTYPELMESRYDSRTRIVSTLPTVAGYMAYAAGQIAAAATVLATLLGWDFTSALMLSSAILVIYTATGGFLAVTYTDWVQFGLLFIGLVLVGIPVAINSGGTWEAFSSNLPAGHYDIGGWGWATILAVVVSICLSFFTGMDSYTRMFAAKSERVAKNGTLLAVVFFVPLAIGATWLGLTAVLLFPDAENSKDILTTFVLAEFPAGLKGLMLAGVIAALMSTADICILTASANLTRDVYQRYINPEVGPLALVRISMGASVFIGTLATLMAWQMRDVISILLVAFTINSAALFIPSIAMVYFARADKNAAFWSILLSLLTVVCWYTAKESGMTGVFTIDPLWPGLTVSFAVFAGLTLFTSPEREHQS